MVNPPVLPSLKEIEVASHMSPRLVESGAISPSVLTRMQYLQVFLGEAIPGKSSVVCATSRARHLVLQCLGAEASGDIADRNPRGHNFSGPKVNLTSKSQGVLIEIKVIRPRMLCKVVSH